MTTDTPANPTMGPTDAAHVLLAKNLLAAGHAGDALAEVAKVVEHSPNLAMGHFLHGMLLAQASRMDEALRALETAVALDEGLFNAWLTLAFLRFDCGLAVEAEQAASRAVALQPRHSRGLMLFGVIYEKLGRLDEAIAVARRALEFDPGFEMAQLRLANWLARSDDQEAALEHAIAALRLNLIDLQARLCLAELLSVVGRHEEAVAECQHAIEMFPGKPQPWLFLGCIQQRHGDDAAAIAALEASLAAAPTQIEAHMQLGQIYLRLKRGDEAVRAFEAALKVEAGFAEARQLLAAAIALRDGTPT